VLALRYHGNKDIRLEEIPEPVAGSGEVRVRVTHTGICATDIEEWQYGPLWVQHGAPNPLTGRQAPLTLGHEITGHIDKLGDGITGVQVGQRVAINNVLTCGTCFWCKRGQQAVCPSMAVAGLSAEGGLAEYIVWPADMVEPLPDSVSDEEAALVEPTTVAVRAVRNSGVKAGDTVAVVGVGTVGLLSAQGFRAAGARVIALDINDRNLAMAKDLGADEAINVSGGNTSEQLLELTDGIGPDIVVETAGAARSPVDAIKWTRRGGTTVLVGIYSATPEMDFNDIVGVERRVVGSVAAGPGDMAAAIRMIGSGQIRVKELITTKVPLERAISDGFERMLLPQKDVYRILIRPGT
jgi:(R,R)-butanediol dehydrogenase/meso-butanediol dehydrogenase/diacetyl reductase